jgi:hypothetical protein
MRRRILVGTERAELAVQLLMFPERLSRAEAIAWASLHGFDHDVVGRSRPFLISALPARDFVLDSFRRRTFRPSGVEAMVGRLDRRPSRLSDELSYLRTDADRRRYERYSRLLRRRAAEGRTHVGVGANTSKNADLKAWYEDWFLQTHPHPSREEIEVKRAIVRGLGQASRMHAFEYVRKLGFKT